MASQTRQLGAIGKRPATSFFPGLRIGDGNDVCQRAYLVHIDKDYIALTLKKLRELSAQGIEEIHEHKLSFAYTAANALPALDGHALSQVLKNYIGPDLNAYSLAKAELGKTTGYEDGGHKIDFTVKLPDGYTSPDEYLADFLLRADPLYRAGTNHN